jgi:hypothetical protein
LLNSMDQAVAVKDKDIFIIIGGNLLGIPFADK